MVKIQDIDYAIAFRIRDTIYINKKTKAIPKLYNSLLKHELAHTSKFGIKDIKLDMKGKYINKKEYYKFLIKNPKAWLQFSPFLKVKSEWSWDLTLLILWIIFCFIILNIILMLI